MTAYGQADPALTDRGKQCCPLEIHWLDRVAQQEKTLAGCSKRLDFSPAQPRRAKTRRSAGKAAAIYHLLWGGWNDPNCAHRTSTVLSCAFCEHWDRPSYPALFFSILLSDNAMFQQIMQMYDSDNSLGAVRHDERGNGKPLHHFDRFGCQLIRSDQLGTARG
jgi:hypothetical protein